MPDSISTNDVDDLVARLQAEGLIDMKAAAKLYPHGNHKATTTRHAVKGIVVGGRRLKLEAILVGGKLCTSKAAVLRFFARQNIASDLTPTPLPRSPHARNRAAQKAEAELDALGVK